MKRLLLLQLIVTMSLKVWPVNASSLSRMYAQPDSTFLSITLRGDEHFHFYTTLDGIPIVEKANAYYYAFVSEDKLEPSLVLAHNKEERNSIDESFIKTYSANAKQWIATIHRNLLTDSNRERYIRKANRTRGVLGQPTSYMGDKKGLVILVEFTNKQMADNSPKEIEKMFNEAGYNNNGHFGSVYDYFLDQSYGKFKLKFDVVGPVQLEHTFGYYGTNKNVFGGSLVDKYTGRMVVEACKMVDDEVNFAKYDWDNDGEVEQVFFIYAGYGEATGGNTTTIWPHEHSLTGCSMSDETVGPLTLDGIKIDTYACSNELDGGSGSKMMGIGVACHEFSHCLGLPDMYDVNYNGGFGMNVWDVMDSGSHSGPKRRGEVPYGYSAYERWFCGWLDYSEIRDSREVIGLKCLSESPTAYIIRNDGYTDEYYIIENHQNQKWYQYAGTNSSCHGLMVTHVDYDGQLWGRNKVNADINHQHLSIIPADNSYGEFYSLNSASGYIVSEEELAGDLFPGLKNVTAITNSSHIDTGGHLFNMNVDGTFNMNKSIVNIKEEDGLISFDVISSSGSVAPIATAATVISKTSFIANWEEMEDADSYVLELTTYKSVSPEETSVETYPDIEENSYRFNNLEYGNYAYRVKAVVQGEDTEWSNSVQVKLSESTGLESVEQNEYGQDKLYNINGSMVVNPRMPGIYIVKKNGKFHKKVVLK